MRPWLIATIFLAAPILLTTQFQVAAAADRQAPETNESLERVVPNGFLRDLYKQALSTLQDYIEWEGNLPGEGSSRQQAGEFRLKLFPQGKSRSGEHLSAEGSFHRAPDSDQSEFTLRFKSSKKSPHPVIPNDEVI
jgi:hypothetical protein